MPEETQTEKSVVERLEPIEVIESVSFHKERTESFEVPYTLGEEGTAEYLCNPIELNYEEKHNGEILAELRLVERRLLITVPEKTRNVADVYLISNLTYFAREELGKIRRNPRNKLTRQALSAMLESGLPDKIKDLIRKGFEGE